MDILWVFFTYDNLLNDEKGLGLSTSPDRKRMELCN